MSEPRPNDSLLSKLVKARYSYVDFLLFGGILVGIAFFWSSQYKRESQVLTQAFFESPLPAIKIAHEANETNPVPADAYKHEYEFTSDWFTWNIPVWQKLFEEVKGAADLRYLEIGVYEGRSALWMLEHVLTHPTSKLTGIDPFDGPYKDRCLANIAKSGAADRVHLITGYSQLVMRELPLESFDIIYIDGSHAKDAVLEDAVLSWRLLKEGGLLIFDDYRWVGSFVSTEIDADTDTPKPAIDSFVQCFDQQCEVMHNSYQLVLRKRKQDRQQ